MQGAIRSLLSFLGLDSWIKDFKSSIADQPPLRSLGLSLGRRPRRQRTGRRTSRDYVENSHSTWTKDGGKVNWLGVSHIKWHNLRGEDQV